LISICTGGGKSKIAIDLAEELDNSNFKGLLVVPTEKLRDVNWKTEFTDWDKEKLYDKFHRSCYVSISKIKDQNFDLVILDEAHRITPNNYEFFKNNNVKAIIALTATPPEEDEKRKLLEELHVKPIFHISLDEGVKLGLVAPYKIKVIEMHLDNKDKYVDAGSKTKPFKSTEVNFYSYLNKLLIKMMYANIDATWLILKRMRFIYNLKSKTELAKKLLAKLPKEDKTLIFCGTINQAEELCENSYHSKSKSSKDLEDFMKGKINYMSCVNSLNEGMNIPNIDTAVIVQLNSKELDLIQRIGRICRYREGHLATIYIICALETQDEKWVAAALSNFSKDCIEYINSKNL
jgi:superfamily II DNA or RNA helicase